MSDLTAIISTVRHGEKDSTGALTKLGGNQARRKAIDIEHLRGDIILFHSGVGRVKETIRSLAAQIHLTNPEEIDEQLEKEFHLQDYLSPKLHYLFDPSNRGDFFSHWDDIELTEENINNRMQNFLNRNDLSSEPEVFPSPKQMAQRVAEVLYAQILFASITASSYRTNFINGTHEPVLMSFLYYALNNFNQGSNDFIQNISGSVEFAEGFDIHVYQQETIITKIELTFRSQTVELELEQIEMFLSE